MWSELLAVVLVPEDYDQNYRGSVCCGLHLEPAAWRSPVCYQVRWNGLSKSHISVLKFNNPANAMWRCLKVSLFKWVKTPPIGRDIITISVLPNYGYYLKQVFYCILRPDHLLKTVLAAQKVYLQIICKLLYLSIDLTAKENILCNELFSK